MLQGWELLLADPGAQEEAGAEQAEQGARLLIDFSSQKGRHAPQLAWGRPRNPIPDTALPRPLARQRTDRHPQSQMRKDTVVVPSLRTLRPRRRR
jgi:hypothetical protein